MFRGVIRYEHTHGPWVLDILEGYPGEQKKLLSNRYNGLRGIIVYPQDQNAQKLFNLARVPTVAIDPPPEWIKTRKRNSLYGIVASNQESVGKMAAETFSRKEVSAFCLRR
jgi:hypothetical protein